MASFDVFNRSAFQLRSMTQAINKIPPKFNYLGSQPGLFTEVGSTTTTIMVEEQEGRLMLVPNSARGTNGVTVPREKRKVRPFICNHKQINDEIRADHVQGVRLFGSETEFDRVQNVVADRMKVAVDSMELTLEYMRVGAVQGIVYDANGDVLHNMFDEFGVTQYAETWKLSGNTIDSVKKKCNGLIRRTMKALGGTPVTGFHILCGNDIFDAIENSKELLDAHRWRNNADFLVDTHAYRYFEYAGVRFVNYLGFVGDKQFIEPNEAYLLPIGVDGMFTINYAPADYTETVNTVGEKFYAKQERLPLDKGIMLECQTNPLVLCTRPGALAKITLQ